MDTCLIDGVGLWLERLTRQIGPGRPALFCDRDGVIVEETQYLGKAEDVHMIPAAASAIKTANDAGVPVVIITNQSGIGRGYYNWQAFSAVQQVIHEHLAAAGAYVDMVLACAFHKAAQAPYAHPDHPWRKPNPGMIEAAADALALDLGASLIIGDKKSDLEAGQRAGIHYGVLVETGHEPVETIDFLPHDLLPMKAAIASDVGTAVQWARSIGWAPCTVKCH